MLRSSKVYCFLLKSLKESKKIQDEMREVCKKMARELGVRGLMNVQLALQDGKIYVIEVNPRASRTVPFVAKATDSAIASIAARLMAGEKLSVFPKAANSPLDLRTGFCWFLPLSFEK